MNSWDWVQQLRYILAVEPKSSWILHFIQIIDSIGFSNCGTSWLLNQIRVGFFISFKSLTQVMITPRIVPHLLRWNANDMQMKCLYNWTPVAFVVLPNQFNWILFVSYKTNLKPNARESEFIKHNVNLINLNWNSLLSINEWNSAYPHHNVIAT